MPNRFICIHGHFYQPPRENPWLGIVEQQDSAYPHHDWNERITAECYAPNTASRILDNQRRIVDIINNYSKISFNFGPTLLSWLELNSPETYRQILTADKESRQRFSGHGSALAQAFNHMILPLANSQDKRTQILWGIADFVHRFQRQPEGLWLPETAVDIESLEIMAEAGIIFTILAPHQAKSVRRFGEDKWSDASGGRIDPKQPYRLNLPSGRAINIFFYDGPISQAVAFERLLENGEVMARRLTNGFVNGDNRDQLVHIATDGETYGHHHRFGDMALAYCLNFIEANNLAQLTIYGEYLVLCPPVQEVKISENSAWSCIHGVERWRDNCGCNTGMAEGQKQEWRKHLRLAQDWLRDQLIPLYEQAMSKYGSDPWAARNAYISLILDRSPENQAKFFQEKIHQPLTDADKIQVLKLLEMQYNAMLMYTSCGWFFDDLGGIETLQVILYAARAIQLAKETAGLDLEPGYLNLLGQAKSNFRDIGDGISVYEKLVKPERLNFSRLAAHYAIASLFEPYPREKSLFYYNFSQESYESLEHERQKLAFGRIKILSTITGEENKINFAVIHLGGQNISGGVCQEDQTCRCDCAACFKEIKEIFSAQGGEASLPLIHKCFGEYNYSLGHLFRDEQRKVLNQIIAPDAAAMEQSLRRMFEQYKPVMAAMNTLRSPLPRILHSAAKFIFNIDLRRELEKERLDLARLKQIAGELKGWPFKLDVKTLSFAAGQQLNRMMAGLFSQPEDINSLAVIDEVIKIFTNPPLRLEPDPWQMQNIYFSLGQKIYPQMKQRATGGDGLACEWLILFKRLGQELKVRIE
ncbi:DUF3536 domain-containing protein [Candidatus Saganbacteria bacterium]|nr:DUF3536 domain-containing protein [Candidatus Saganbacteria bacterium]